MSDTSHPLFPPLLDEGSCGGAVDVLHMLLDGWGFGDGIVPDLEYGKVTAARVADLQRWLGVEADGNFGPMTRTALKDKTGFDVNRIGWAPQDGFTTWFDPKVNNYGAWPLADP